MWLAVMDEMDWSGGSGFEARRRAQAARWDRARPAAAEPHISLLRARRPKHAIERSHRACDSDSRRSLTLALLRPSLRPSIHLALSLSPGDMAVYTASLPPPYAPGGHEDLTLLDKPPPLGRTAADGAASPNGDDDDDELDANDEEADVGGYGRRRRVRGRSVYLPNVPPG